MKPEETFSIADIVGTYKHLPLTWEQACERATRYSEGGKLFFVVGKNVRDTRAIAHDGKLYLPQALATPQPATAPAREPATGRYVVRRNIRYLWNVIDTNEKYVSHGNIVLVDFATEHEAEQAAAALNADSTGQGGE